MADSPGRHQPPATAYNAKVNAHMMQVNDRLGFVPVARFGEFQKRQT